VGRSADISAAYNAVAVTKNDSTVFPTTRSLFIGAAGDVAVRMASGATLTFSNVAAGIFPVQVDKVLSTGTTATGIVALY
jgi:hypothetical protein